MKTLDKWSGIALVNLAIVALLGFTLRCKMLFSISFVDFKHLLHAHSHFAFGGWVTLALLALMTFRLLPSEYHSRSVYKWLLAGILANALGMLVSFPFQGYGLFSIIFSTLFIFVSYGYTAFFIKHVRKTALSAPVKLLSIASLIYMSLSSVGAYALAYFLATKSNNVYLYKDAIYTYLHLQYSGFFTLAVFALLIHYFKVDNKHALRFARLLTYSVIPSMFISYLWHYPGLLFQVIAVLGSTLIVLSTLVFFKFILSARPGFARLNPVARSIGIIALVSFVLKMLFQALTIVPSLGSLVFANRPVIIGFLHLVLLGFVSLFILAYFIQSGLLRFNKLSGVGFGVFVFGVVLNELVLFAQGLGFMLMLSSSFANWLLLIAGACLFSGATMIAFSKWSFANAPLALRNPIKSSCKSFS